MRRCLKVLNLLIEKKVAEVEGDKLKAWEYEGMIKRHVEECPSCCTFLGGMYEKSKMLDAHFYQLTRQFLRKSEKKFSSFKQIDSNFPELSRPNSSS